MSATGVPYAGAVINQFGGAVAGASVAIVDDAGDITVFPGSPLASLFQDEALTIPIANPLFADEFGRFQFFTSTGTYYAQVYGDAIPFPYAYCRVRGVAASLSAEGRTLRE